MYAAAGGTWCKVSSLHRMVKAMRRRSVGVLDAICCHHYWAGAGIPVWKVCGTTYRYLSFAFSSDLPIKYNSPKLVLLCCWTCLIPGWGEMLPFEVIHLRSQSHSVCITLQIYERNQLRGSSCIVLPMVTRNGPLRKAGSKEKYSNRLYYVLQHPSDTDTYVPSKWGG